MNTSLVSEVGHRRQRHDRRRGVRFGAADLLGRQRFGRLHAQRRRCQPGRRADLQRAADRPDAHATGTNTVAFALNAIANVTLNASGAGEFSVGGKITVTTATVDGDYSATVNVVANYL